MKSDPLVALTISKERLILFIYTYLQAQLKSIGSNLKFSSNSFKD